MWWVPLAASAIGAVGSMAASKNQPQTSQTSTDNRTWSQFTPHPATQPLYGMLAGGAQQMGQIPTPFFPGQTYVDPSLPTQQGVNLGMQGSQATAATAPLYNQAGSAYGALSPLYNQAGSAYGALSPLYNQAGSAYGAQMPLYEGASQMGQGVTGNQLDILDTAGGNYNFLSGAADVANNPYVQNLSLIHI